MAQLKDTLVSGNLRVTNTAFTDALKSDLIIKNGGTSSQFLKADGSVDSNAYAKLSDTITTEFYKEVSGYTLP